MTKKIWLTYGIKLIVPLYMFLYMIAFYFLEKRGMYRIHVIHTNIDYSIPFCEYFIIPYLLWFLFIVLTVLWFMFKNPNKKEYIQLVLSLILGMTVFLVISWIFPNGHLLRPHTFPRDNVFTDMVRMLYKSDTSTNILPSIHVFNSIAACIAILRCEKLQNKHLIRKGTLFLTIMIVLATLFLKQHSIVDVLMAFGLNFIIYMFVYSLDDRRVFVDKCMTVRSSNL